MKKLLSILASVGLTATASTAVVACTSTQKVKSDKIDGIDGSVTIEKSIKFDKGTVLKADTETVNGKTVVDGYEVSNSAYAIVKDTKDATKKKAAVVSAVEYFGFYLKDASKIDATKDLENGALKKAKTLKVEITISDKALMNSAKSETLKLALVKLGTDSSKTDEYGKVASVVEKIKISTPTWDTPSLSDVTTGTGDAAKVTAKKFTTNITVDAESMRSAVAEKDGNTIKDYKLPDGIVKLADVTLGAAKDATIAATFTMSAADGNAFTAKGTDGKYTMKDDATKKIAITVTFPVVAAKKADATYIYQLQQEDGVVAQVTYKVAADSTNGAEVKPATLENTATFEEGNTTVKFNILPDEGTALPSIDQTVLNNAVKVGGQAASADNSGFTVSIADNQLVVTFAAEQKAVATITVADIKSTDKTPVTLITGATLTANLYVADGGNTDGGNTGDKDNSKVTIKSATINNEGTVITLTTDKLGVDAKQSDITVTGATVTNLDGKKGSTTITITVSPAVAKGASLTVSGYATTKAITVDTSSITAA